MNTAQSTAGTGAEPATHIPRGYSDAGLCTRNFEPWIELLTGPAGWRQDWQREIPPGLLRFWGLAGSSGGQECQLSRPGQVGGRIRLFCLENTEQVVIREHTQSWDSGGIFDLDFRLCDLRPWVGKLEGRDWSGISAPVDWRFGKAEVREWLVRGWDSVIFALIQRLAPPLEGQPDWQGLGHAFNSSQIVRDMAASQAFYASLGFKVVVAHQGPLPGRGGEVLGLDPASAPATAVSLVIMQPQGQMEGSVELVSFESPGTQGKDVSARAQPWNLGLNLLRFPVADLDGFMQHLVRQNIPLAGGPALIELSPGSQSKLIAIRSPDGCWLEFYEAAAAANAPVPGSHIL